MPSRLSPERWRALGPYLDDALEIPTADRPTWLATLGVQDAVLAADVRALLGPPPLASGEDPDQYERLFAEFSAMVGPDNL